MSRYIIVELRVFIRQIIFSLCFSPASPYLELVNFLLTCGDEVRSWVSRRLRGQCEHHWGALCGSFTGGCTLSQSDAPQPTTTTPPPHTAPWPLRAQEALRQPSGAAEPDARNIWNQTDNVTESSVHVFEKASVAAS